MKRRSFALILALALLLPLLPGCRKGEKEKAPAVLGNRYTSAAYPRGSGSDPTPQGSTPIVWDEAAGAVSYLQMDFQNVPLQDNKWGIRLVWTVVTANEDAVLREEELPLDEHASIAAGWLEEDSFTFLFSIIDYDNPRPQGTPPDFSLGRYDRNTGEVTASECVNRFFNPDRIYTEAIAVGPDGTIFLAGMEEILVFTPDFVYLRTIPTGGFVARLGKNGAGELCAVTYENEGSRMTLVVSALDGESGTAEERFRVREDTVGNPRFGPGRDLYYENDAGVWGVTAREDGSAETELLMDYAASNISRYDTVFQAVRDEDRFFFTEQREREGEDRWVFTVVLFSRAEDLDLSEVVTLTLAYSAADSRLREKIVAFNKAHPEIRIVPEDYSRFDTSEDPQAGQKKLATDMVTGVFRPDLVVGSDINESIRQLRAKKLYRDLAPYVEKDGLVNRENLFGAVQRAFDDGEGGIWGLSASFTLMTLVSTRELLGDRLADQGCWTFSEMVDYVASLPDGVDFASNASREMLSALLFNFGGADAFLDREAGTCSFDGPEFRKFLELAVSLPSLEEAEQRSPLNGLSPDEAYLPYFEGKIALRDFPLDAPEAVIGLPTLFNTDDWVLIGVPVSEKRAGAGTVTEFDSIVAVTSFCEAPDEAWTFVRSLFEGSYPLMLGGTNRFPAIRSQLDEVIRMYQDAEQEFVYFYSGSHRMRLGNREEPTDPASMEAPCIVSFFTEEHRAVLYGILDASGCPTSPMNEEIQGIIGEELSALFAGASSIDDCAKRIQSRAAIWMAEHR